MRKQRFLYDSGNELAAFAAKQINYNVMGYYPITPSTQIAEELDLMYSNGEHDISLIPAEGEHSAAGICYGASCGGGRVFNATSANGLLYALEQLPVQSGTRMPMVMNVACRTTSAPLCIKGDHSDIMYTLNCGWIILFANSVQSVYDMNIMAVKISETVSIPVIVAFDGFFTSHQKRKCAVFENDSDVREFLGSPEREFSLFDMENPVSIGGYMNEPDLTNNKYQLYLAMNDSRSVIDKVFAEYGELSGRSYKKAEGYMCGDAETVMFILGSSYHTAAAAADELRAEGMKVGVCTVNVLRPFPKKEICEYLASAKNVIICDRQDSCGGDGGNMSFEIKSAMLDMGISAKVITRIYGLGGQDFLPEDAKRLFEMDFEKCRSFDYIGQNEGGEVDERQYFAPLKPEDTVSPFKYSIEKESAAAGSLSDAARMPFRIAPGHGACPGCGIPVNINLLLKGISGNVILLFQTGCGMIITTPYPKTAFKVPYLHNLFQNGAATLSGLERMFESRRRRGEIPDEDITFIMISGDGGMDIGMGSAIGTALRNSGLIIFEYDNGGYMNTGYQLSYSTPKGAKSSTSHVGENQYGKRFYHKDTPEIMAAANTAYVATAAESEPLDFIKKAAKAQEYSKKYGTAYIKALSACPLNWGDRPDNERSVIDAAVKCCYFPLYEVCLGITRITVDPKDKKIPTSQWLGMMGRTKHLLKSEYAAVAEDIQAETDRRWKRLIEKSNNPLL